jgi:glycosyltransferase involved in cell wall biosynthesis
VNSRILFVDQTGQVGGAELCLADLAAHLTDSGTVLLFEAGPFRRLLAERGVKVVILGEGSNGPSPVLWQLRSRRFGENIFRRIYPLAGPKVNKKSKVTAYIYAVPGFVRVLIGTLRVARTFDLLYANTAKALIVTALVARALRKPFLFHLHDVFDAEHFSSFNRWLLTTAADLAAGIIANSEATAQAYRKAGGRNRNLKVLPNGFDIERFRAGTGEEIFALRSTICKEDQFLVGLFGRITEWKGQKVLIQAISRLPAVAAVIVGDALFTDEDQRYKRELVDLAQQLGVADRVHFAGFQQNVVPFLHAVDLVVHCSVSPEPFGRVIVEAQLAGKPVVAAKCGAPMEIVRNGISGILVNPGDAEELARAIDGLLRDPARAGAMASQGRESAEKRYALANVLRDWVEFIDRTVGGRTMSRQPGGSPPRHHSEAGKIEGRNINGVGRASKVRPTKAGVSA